MWPDVRLALRQVKQKPAYALTCIAVLGFGLGACTAVFSALYAAALKPLPYPQPDQLVMVRNRFPELHLRSMGASPSDYSNLAAHHELFAETGAYYFLDLSLSGVEVPKKVNAVAISSSLFQILGAQPMVGRAFSGVEQRYRGPHAVILSEEYWQSEFARDPAILHRSLRLNGELYPVIGVMPKSFSFPNGVTQMWTPLALRDLADNRNFYLRMYARVAPGLDFTRASSRIEQLSHRIAVENPEAHAIASKGWSYFLNPMARNDDGSVRRWLWILFAAVACFLLIVCSNVAGLVLVRSSERRFDLAVRMALGAGRWRIVRQVLTEVLLLAACGGLAGLAIARTGVALLARYGPTTPPRLETPVFWFCAALSLLTGIVCGVYPALHSARIASVSAGGLAESGSHRTAGQTRRRWQQGLIVAQVAVATALLICGGLLIHSLLRLLQTPLGFDPRGVLTMTISLPPLRYPQPESRARFFEAALDQVSAIPGVDLASACTLLPFGYGENVNTFQIVGQTAPLVAPLADLSTVSSGYFNTMRIPLLRGRVFTPQDRAETAPSIIIDETFAHRFFAGEDPLGRQLKMPWGLYTITGVVGSVKISGLDVDSPPTLYFSAAQSPVTDMTLTIRSGLPRSAIVRDVQGVVSRIDADQPVYDVAPLQSRIDRSLKTRRFVVWLMLVFAAAGTGLAALGLFGLLSYTVALRRREMGVRMALGADCGAIAMLVCRGGMTLVAAGLLLGSAAALAAYRFIASQMYGVGIADRITWLAVLGIVGASGLVASALPAWRLTRISPAEALRTDG